MASGLDIAQKTFYIKIITRHLEGQVLTAVGLRSNFTKFSFCGKFSGVAFKGKGGFPLSEIFRPNRNFLLSYKHSDGTNQKSFEFEQ